ncbi:E3 SUMO-protein ligase KIAA1586-like [Photinus pyralis]|uniref:E3 SUMO-protein ligase KIAA1586-like n=1 Tax=Photinus pyralis TaxID=7054 RepID=UPI0012675A57|nr:E3 SUMO-protein ligase KIAA1586-like [Photinus pyralis]
MSLLNWLKRKKNDNDSGAGASTDNMDRDADADYFLPSQSESDSVERDNNSGDETDESESGAKKLKFNNLPDVPECWTIEMYNRKCVEYKWLETKEKKLGCSTCKKIKNLGNVPKKQGVQVSTEWVNCNIAAFGDSTKKQRQSLRKKIFHHKTSEAHRYAEEILTESHKERLKTSLTNQSTDICESTNRVFTTVYNIIKKGRPFTDLTSDIDMQVLNGLKMGRILHSDHACADIANHIATEMRKRIVSQIIQNESKISVLIDETTSVSKNTVLVVCIKTTLPHSEPVTFFLDLIDLETTTSSNIFNMLMLCLEKHGFTNDFLARNLVCFASDGASNMIGKKSGVATQLISQYPDLVVWHCSNHRLELAVHDVLEEVDGINHFKIFFDKLYSLYSASPKNQ